MCQKSTQASDYLVRKAARKARAAMDKWRINYPHDHMPWEAIGVQVAVFYEVLAGGLIVEVPYATVQMSNATEEFPLSAA